MSTYLHPQDFVQSRNFTILYVDISIDHMSTFQLSWPKSKLYHFICRPSYVDISCHMSTFPCPICRHIGFTTWWKPKSKLYHFICRISYVDLFTHMSTYAFHMSTFTFQYDRYCFKSVLSFCHMSTYAFYICRHMHFFNYPLGLLTQLWMGSFG